ncbi:hypothetical protein ACFW04_013770 [Cataglyphis niger]
MEIKHSISKYCCLVMRQCFNIIENVRDNCLQFYVTAAEKISKKSPIKDKFLTKLTVFQFNTALCSDDREISFNNDLLLLKVSMTLTKML